MVCECVWDLDLSDCCNNVSTVSPDKVTAAATSATQIMSMLSGGYYAGCPETLRPLGECNICRRTPCCGSPDRVKLHAKAPISSVSEVRLDGVVLDPAGYRFTPSTQLLYRVNPDIWPRRDNPSDAVGSLEVDVIVGMVPDAYTLSVAKSLACELVKSACDVKCRIPKNATQVGAQGVTVTLDVSQFKTLLPEVAAWADLVNPYDKKNPVALWSPDLDTVGAGSGCGCR